jgi:exosortase
MENPPEQVVEQPALARETPHRWVLWLVAAGLLLLYAPTLTWLWDRWTMSVWHNAHGVLIVAAIAYLVRRELSARSQLPPASSAWGFVFLAPALLSHALDAGMHTQLLSAVSLVLAVPGLALLFLGVERTRSIAFLLFFLMLALPIPLAATEQLHLVLRQVATAATALVIPWFGIPLYAEGTSLLIPNGTLQIADACSGFSTLYAAVAVACLTAYGCPAPGRRLLVLLLAAPIAILANVLRVILLTLLVHWFGIEILNTSLHTISGLFTFVLALPLIFWLGNAPSKKEVQG